MKTTWKFSVFMMMIMAMAVVFADTTRKTSSTISTPDATKKEQREKHLYMIVKDSRVLQSVFLLDRLCLLRINVTQRHDPGTVRKLQQTRDMRSRNIADADDRYI